jgi:hypothetical protein
LTPQTLVSDSALWLGREPGFPGQVAPDRAAYPLFDKSNRTDGTFSRCDFVFDAEQDGYACPKGKHPVQFHRTYAAPRSGITKEGTRTYRASMRECNGCTLKLRCCRVNSPARSDQ